ncbi:uncharacterized protein TEOVI_000291200 [Trypanosoma equiperdum]|uniref:Uncharacterized protein n=4 Tax=Trypanozoon TaxID=39700 RepID=Q38AB0_TRYB2|nr:hypothetical protein, conserved [Trypanosoma brucei brucei TREU927]6HIV_A4 Chain A4, bL31m [Trypanosoma brucei brucei]6HIX_A4 Chain A4, bl31m [Trypanosoma brucei brucei]RHW68611.1 hypothetical protein DPX39_100093300 [Trypanosoma brucei equiperdum]SCU71331.1 hypothetical protein, conserved [Trypanosoma equiperdum]EAN78260.1 hypothetical protein, conserved [Trypanosoma brucei brucei TREU927]
MVLHKWAVVSRSAPPPRGLRPIARTIPTHPRLRPVDYKIPYVLRTFIKDRHTSEVQHLENRGMFAEELSIERSRFPRFHSTFTIQTDGSLNEREFEFAVPPIVTLFHDRLSAHRERQLELAKIGKLRKERNWETEQKGEESVSMACNALAFPYCIPKNMLKRSRVVDPLNSKSSTQGVTSGGG